MNKTWIRLCIFLLLFFPVFLGSPSRVFAQQTCAEKNPCGSDDIACLQKVVESCQNKEKTLTGEINYMNSQIQLTTVQISGTQAKIKTLTEEIEKLGTEVQKLEEILNSRISLLLRRIPLSYKRSSVPDFATLLFSKDFFDFITRIKYVRTVQEQDAALVFRVKSTQNSYNESKATREGKKAQLEEVKAQLVQQSSQLTLQKKTKDALLTQTKGQEATYQQLLAQALAEKQALESALIRGVQVGPVKRGDPIALVGNSGFPGCSSGAHLHFEVRKNNSWVDPASYLSNKTVSDEQNGGTWNIGSGSWEWPIADTIRMTQHFGKTPWSWRYAYSGGIHTGFDMVSSSSIVIRAPSDGVMYSSSETCGSSSIIKIKYIDHGDGVLSFYLHVQ